ncbi:ferritin-like domain-containing protein [Nannocystis punicea]|uniref:Ferritin-like domain-containing protein n=1 Tax=Nannocystis punicea TaxID=2995304 RepID=A0ABY7HKA7_9BACT|nr:ferritin-like domain-containing protein [Nannocystis poenicansa]WAS99294.1 ferritin-like domain-containing protein [Nannocystis poenicansa]
MSAASSSLACLRVALLHALGLGAAAGCTRPPLGDDTATATGTTTTTTTTSATTAPATTSVPPDPTTGATTTTGAATTLLTTATTGVDSSTGPVTTTGEVEPATTTTTSSTTDDTTTTTSSDETTGTTGATCRSVSALGDELMPTDLLEIPGCEEFNASDCFDYVRICVPVPDGLQSCDECVPDCLGDLPELCKDFGFLVACGPLPADGQCCHVVQYSWNCQDGRPFLVEGTARTAAPTRRRDWLADATGPAPAFVAGLDPAARAELAALWTADALAEHASVASFARFTLQLLAHGAPPGLVQEACAAQLDEVVHARLTFALASDYAGAPVGPGPLATDDALGGPGDLAAVVAAVVREGCVGETLAAAELDLAARTCEDPALAATLRRIAADEQRHAALAWRTVQWALGRGGPALRRVVAEALAVRIAAPPPDRLDPAVLRRHGRLPAGERVALAAQCMRSVVLPCARALLDDLAVARPTTDLPV